MKAEIGRLLREALVLIDDCIDSEDEAKSEIICIYFS